MNTPADPAQTGIHHLKLPVTDLARSTDWYRAVLGARHLTELDHRRPDGTLFAVILDVPGLSGYLELRLAPATAKALQGYDFLTLAIADRAGLDELAAGLDALGIRHSPPIVAMAGWLLVVPDPDGLCLRFYTTEPHGLGESAVEFDSPWVGVGSVGGADDSVICAVGRLSALPGHTDEVLSLMHIVAQATRQEVGCLAYRVHRTEDAPNTIVVYESWASRDAMAAHHRSEHMKLFEEGVTGLVDWPPRAELLIPEP
ncbi:antibiotic biosynthesis monooxygenase [Nocardia sp. NPDC060256]|uniref:antibiotic biosynthesis monooxygenase n=1 Tax=unclassified Nocardia TaxID=2637762 RepID=UPI00366763FA